MLKRWGIFGFFLLSMIGFVTLPVAHAVDSGTIATGYESDQELAIGTIVSVDSTSNSTRVTSANTSNVSRLIGVVSKGAVVELSSGSGRYTVATEGVAVALVSDLNGEIKKGDPITASPVSGIGMKAVESTQIVGRANASFDEAMEKTVQSVTLTDGTQRDINIGLIPVMVDVAAYQKEQDDMSFLPSFLQNIANNVAGRSVSPLRVIAALFVLVAGLGAAAVMLSASVRSSIISIGRNPLSAKAVHRSLFEVGGIGVGILIVMLIAVYLILIL